MQAAAENKTTQTSKEPVPSWSRRLLVNPDVLWLSRVLNEDETTAVTSIDKKEPKFGRLLNLFNLIRVQQF